MLHRVEHGMFVRDYPGEAPTPLLFIHGLGESGLCFESIVEHPELLRFPCAVIDLPGYGRSSWQAEPGSLLQLAQRVTTWAEQSTNKPVLVGHSMGGVVALLAAERHSQTFAGVVDVDGNKSLEDCAFSGRAAKMALEQFVGGGFDAMMLDIHGQGAGDAAHRGYYASLRLCDPRAYHAHSHELVMLSEGERLADRLAGLSTPKLYVAGQPGGACCRSMELLARAGVETVSIEPSGHWPFIDRPDAFASALVGFLETIDTTAP